MAKDTKYISDITNFIRSLYKTDPQIYPKQVKLRDTWWDKSFIDDDEQQSYAKNKVKLDGYAYYSYKNYAKT